MASALLEIPAESLAGIRLLAGIDPGGLEALERRARWHQAAPGSEIFSRDDTGCEVYFVVSGRISIVNYSTSGREVAYATAEAGDYFGELAAIDEERRSAAAVALDEARLACVEAETFRTLLADEPQVALRVLSKLAHIVRACDEKIMDLATLSAYQRVYSEILNLARPDPVNSSGWIVYPLPTQAQIASRANTTRETVARVLGQLSSSGIAERKSKTLYLRDRSRLETLAERTGAQGGPPR